MKAHKIGWEDIPSLEDIMVDWDYGPENPLGKRASARISRTDLHSLLSVKNIPTKVIAHTAGEIGCLIDISPTGFAVLLENRLSNGQPVRIGFFLGKKKVLARAVVRNVHSTEEKFRTGMEFAGLDREDVLFIAGLFSSKVYKNCGYK